MKSSPKVFVLHTVLQGRTMGQELHSALLIFGRYALEPNMPKASLHVWNGDMKTKLYTYEKEKTTMQPSQNNYYAHLVTCEGEARSSCCKLLLLWFLHKKFSTLLTSRSLFALLMLCKSGKSQGRFSFVYQRDDLVHVYHLVVKSSRYTQSALARMWTMLLDISAKSVLFANIAQLMSAKRNHST